MPMDTEALERHLKTSDPTVQVFSTSKQWLRAVIDEVKGYRQRITDLEADNVNLRAELARLRAGATTTKIIRDGKEVNDAPFPEKEFDEAMGFMDKAFASMDSMFTKIGRRK